MPPAPLLRVRGWGTQPGDRDNDPPQDTARRRGARPRHTDEPGALAATQAPRDTHPAPTPPIHPTLLTAWPSPHPTGGENTAPESPTGVGTPPKKERGSGRAPAPCAPPAPNTARSEVAPALAGAGRPCQGEGAQHGPPARPRHGGTGGLRYGRACKQPGWGVNKPLGDPHPGQAPWLNGGGVPGPSEAAQGPPPPFQCGIPGVEGGGPEPEPLTPSPVREPWT